MAKAVASRKDQIPRWWREAIDEAREAQGVSNADLAEAWAGTRQGRAYEAAKVRVSKFFSGKTTRVVFARWLAKQLNVPDFAFFASSIAEAKSLYRVQRIHKDSNPSDQVLDILDVTLDGLYSSVRPKAPPASLEPAGHIDPSVPVLRGKPRRARLP